MSWGAIKLRLSGTDGVVFDGEASPAPGGGSMSHWIGPIAFDHTMAEIGAGNFADLGIISLPDFSGLPVDTLILRVARTVTTGFDNVSGGMQLYVSDPAGANGYTWPTMGVDNPNAPFGPMREAPAVLAQDSGDADQTIGAVSEDVTIATLFWTPDVGGLPTAGAGKLWLEAILPPP